MTVCEPSHLQHGMRTKRALPRISRATDRNASESAHPRRPTAKNARCDRHFWRRQLRHGVTALRHSRHRTTHGQFGSLRLVREKALPLPWCLLIPEPTCRRSGSKMAFTAFNGAHLFSSTPTFSARTFKNYLTLSRLLLN